MSSPVFESLSRPNNNKLLEEIGMESGFEIRIAIVGERQDQPTSTKAHLLKILALAGIVASSMP
jgi:hypothetical protein